MLGSEKILKTCIVFVLISFQVFLLGLDLRPSFSVNKFAWERGDKLICITDFVRYYVAGQMARSPDSQNIYQIPAHYPYVHNIIQPFSIEHESAINFTPSAIAVMSVVSLLPFYPAYVTWCSLGLLSALVALLLFLIQTRKFKILDAFILSLLALNSFTAFLNIRVGQWVDWLIGLYLLFFWSSCTKKEVLSGIVLGFLAVKPQYMIPLVLVTIVQRRWKTLVVSGLTFFALTAYAASLIGWHNVFIYSQVATSLECLLDVGIVGHAQASLRGFFTNILPINLAFKVSSACYFLAVALFFIGIWLKRESIQKAIMWIWSLGILIGMAFSPHSLNYDMTLFVLPAALTLKTINPRSVLQMKSMSMKIWHITLLLYPFCSWLICCGLPLTMTYMFAVLNLTLIVLGIIILSGNKSEPTEERQLDSTVQSI